MSQRGRDEPSGSFRQPNFVLDGPLPTQNIQDTKPLMGFSFAKPDLLDSRTQSQPVYSSGQFGRPNPDSRRSSRSSVFEFNHQSFQDNPNGLINRALNQ